MPMLCYSDDYDMIFDDSNVDYCESLQDKLDKEDFHCWVEDAQGKVVFDAEDFFELENIKMIRGCVGDSIRVPFLEQKVALRHVIASAVEKQRQSDKYGIPWEHRWFNQEHNGEQIYQFGMCNINCLHFLKHNKNQGYKMVVGAKGWRTQDGEAWFEWG